MRKAEKIRVANEKNKRTRNLVSVFKFKIHLKFTVFSLFPYL